MPKDCSDSCIRNKNPGLHTVYPDGITKVAVQCEKEGLTVSEETHLLKYLIFALKTISTIVFS